MLGNSLHRFKKCKSCMTNPVVFCSDVTGFMDEEGAMNVTHSYFSNAFHIVSHSICVAKPKRHGVDTQITRWTEAGWTDGLKGLWSVMQITISGQILKCLSAFDSGAVIV